MIFLGFKEYFDESHHTRTKLECGMTVLVTWSFYKCARDVLVVIMAFAEEVCLWCLFQCLLCQTSNPSWTWSRRQYGSIYIKHGSLYWICAFTPSQSDSATFIPILSLQLLSENLLFLSTLFIMIPSYLHGNESRRKGSWIGTVYWQYILVSF